MSTENKICPTGFVDDLGKGWKPMSEKIPTEPHRNIQTLSLDGEGKVSTSLTSSWIAGACCAVMWRENVSELNAEQKSILEHTNKVKIFCGDSPDMKILCDKGLMESAGRKSFVPDEYFMITDNGISELQNK